MIELDALNAFFIGMIVFVVSVIFVMLMFPDALGFECNDFGATEIIGKCIADTYDSPMVIVIR
jgi:hypothetical protein